MPDSSKSIARALGAVDDAAELLRLAQGAAERARAETDADAAGVAQRLSQQIQFLRKVNELLRHEIDRAERERGSLLPAGVVSIRDRSAA